MAESGNLPNLVIIGAMKSGTTSLHYYLDLHPEIIMSRQKELNFFIEDRNWSKGLRWYESNFVGTAKVYGESSPDYTKYPSRQGVPRRMFSTIPEAKLIYILRNPIERIVSQYIHFCSVGVEERSLEEALAQLDRNMYVKSSRYFFQLEQYLEFFSPANILILTSEELANSPQETMRKVFQFLEVDDRFQFEFGVKDTSSVLRFGPALLSSQFQFNTKLHASSRKRKLKVPKDHPAAVAISKVVKVLPPEIGCHAEKLLQWPISEQIGRPQIGDSLAAELRDYLAEDIRKLQAYSGRDFSEWGLDLPAREREST